MPRQLLGGLGVAMSFYLLSRLGLKLAVPPHGITVLWLPNAVILAVLLLSETRSWRTILGAIIAVEFVINVIEPKSLVVNVGYPAANVAEITVSAVLLRRFCGPNITLRKVSEVVYFVVIAVLLSCAGSATIAALTAVYAYKESTFLSAWQTWFVADAMGVIVLTPALLTWVPRADGRPKAIGPGRKLEALALFALLTLVSEFIFGHIGDAGIERLPLMYLVFPFVLWAAVRFGPRGVAAASLLVTIFAVVNASLGYLGSGDVANAVHWIQVYLVVVVLSGLLLAAVWSERSDATAALDESNERLARTEAFALVMTTHLGLDGRWLKVPPTLCRRLRYKERALLSKTLKDLVHPDDFDALWGRMRGLLEGGPKSIEAEVRLLRRQGNAIWIDISCSLVTDSSDAPAYFLTYIRDITERKRAEKLLRKEKEYTSSIVSRAPAIICSLAPDGTTVSVNPAVTKTTGFTPDELVGKSFWELLYPSELSAESERARAVLEQHTGASCETVLRAKDGTERIVSWSAATQADGGGRPAETILIGSDVTARRQAEEALRRTLDRLEERVEARTKELLLANDSLAVEIGERKRAEEALRDARDELEVRVRERTQELVRTNEALEAEIEERRRAEAIISQQAREILDLSTPIVKLWPGMELVPLIGSFDRGRAQQLTTRLLERVAREGSRYVLLDVTGVPSIDTATAQHLLKTIGAVRLLGAEAVLTGMRPSIARTLVDLGIDLAGIETQSSLAVGLSAMLRGGRRRRW